MFSICKAEAFTGWKNKYFCASMSYVNQGSGCSVAVEQMSDYREVVSSNPVSNCILHKVPRGGAILLIFKYI